MALFDLTSSMVGLGAELSQADKNIVVAAFMTSASSQEQAQPNDPGLQERTKPNGTLITWQAFYETIETWILGNG